MHSCNGSLPSCIDPAAWSARFTLSRQGTKGSKVVKKTLWGLRPRVSGDEELQGPWNWLRKVVKKVTEAKSLLPIPTPHRRQ